MSQLWDGLRSFGTTIKNVFRTPTTVQFPKEKRERSERYRTSFALLHDEDGDEACVGCLQCERICPSQVITVIAEKKESPVSGKRRGYAKDFVLDLNACIFCELCVQVCPTDAIVMTRLPESPGYSREDLCLTMDRLYENEKVNPATWGTATLLMEMQNPKRGEPPKAKTKKAAPKPVDETKITSKETPGAKTQRAGEGEPTATPSPQKTTVKEPPPSKAPPAAKPVKNTASPTAEAKAGSPGKTEGTDRPSGRKETPPAATNASDEEFNEVTVCETPESKRSVPPLSGEADE